LPLLLPPSNRSVLFTVLSFALLVASFAAGAESIKKRFDLPAGGAEKSLKDFAAQSGLEVLFITEMAAGVRTKAVKGDFFPAEAMKRMLNGTGLAAVQDEKTGTFTISRELPPATSPNSETPKKKLT